MRHRLTLLSILLVAAWLRLYGLVNLSPPGLAHDEVANWLIDRSILAGNHALYFTEAYGHEAGFHYVQAAFVSLLGDNALALRLPAAFAGIVLVAVTYALVRLLFKRKTALIAAALLAVLFWPVFYSRLGLRAIYLPLLSGLTAYAWWRGMAGAEKVATAKQGPIWKRAAVAWLALAGVLAGLSLYTYMAARAVPIIFGLFLIYLVLFDWRALRRNWPGLLAFWIVFALVALPLATYLMTNPEAEFRISEIDAPLRALGQGMFGPVLENSLRAIGLFGVQGDPLWRQNVAPAPVFDPVIALLTYAGLLLCLWRLRDKRYAFVLLWVLISMVPSIVTKDAPSTIRSINILPLLTALPALVIHSLSYFSTTNPQLSTKRGINWWINVLTILLILFHLGRTSVWLFRTWPANEEVAFVWQEALTQAATYLDEQPESGPVAVGGWTPDTMDPPTMALTLRRNDLALRHFDPTGGLVVPAGERARIVYPKLLPLAPALAKNLDDWGATVQTYDAFTVYTLPGEPVPLPQFPADEVFGQELQFLGYDLDGDCPATESESCRLISYWRVVAPASSARRLFVHMLDYGGEIAAQDDQLSAPAVFWQAGDLVLQQHVLQRHLLDEPGPNELQIRLGVYDPATGVRLMTEQGADAVLLP